MVVQLAVNDFLGCRNDGFAELGVEAAERDIGAGCRLLDDAECANNCQRLLFPADLEIAEGALCLRAPVAVALDFDRPKVSVSVRVVIRSASV